MLGRLASATSQDFSAQTFESRLRIQKAIYFLQAFGYPPASEYPFSDYFHGPYAPALADQYYELRKAGPVRATSSSVPDFPPHAIEFLREATRAGNDTLEAAATLHAFLARQRRPSRQAALAYLGQVKGWLANRGGEALALLERHHLVSGVT